MEVELNKQCISYALEVHFPSTHPRSHSLNPLILALAVPSPFFREETDGTSWSNWRTPPHPVMSSTRSELAKPQATAEIKKGIQRTHFEGCVDADWLTVLGLNVNRLR